MTYQEKNVEALRGNAEYAIRPNNNTSTEAEASAGNAAPVARPNTNTPTANSLLHGVTDVNGTPLLAEDRPLTPAE